MDDAREETEIIRAVQAGRRERFSLLVEKYKRRAFLIALSLVHNREDAMDIAQDAFLKSFRAIKRFDLTRPFFPWFYRIVRNTALNQKRDESRHKGDCPLEWVTEPARLPSPLQAAEAEELRVRLWEAVDGLPEEFREVFLLYTFQGLKYREIADLLDIPLGTVMSRLHSARRRIRQHLGEQEVPA